MTEINKLQKTLYFEKAEARLVDTTSGMQIGPSFLSVTNRFDPSTLKGIVFEDDVINGTVENEIKNTEVQSNLIKKVIAKNVEGSTFDSDNMSLNASVPVKIKDKTNASKLLSNLQYDKNYDNDVQQKILTQGVNTLVDWLDDYINNYDKRVAEGKNRGDSEVKLSFLLKLRNSIENCDFPVGFAARDSFVMEPDQGYVVLGSYGWAQINNYLNPEDHTNDNAGILKHLNRSITLNAGVFCVDRKYTTEKQLQDAINSGAYNYLRKEGITNADLIKALSEMLMASDDFYYNFASAYFASILAHELIHSVHITNEAVTYNTCEMIEDDFRNQAVFANWSPATQEAVDKIFENLDLNSYTYDMAYLPTAGGNLGFHDLGDYDEVAAHGHYENTAYPDYIGCSTGDTVEDDKKELMNFIV